MAMTETGRTEVCIYDYQSMKHVLQPQAQNLMPECPFVIEEYKNMAEKTIRIYVKIKIFQLGNMSSYTIRGIFNVTRIINQ